MTEPSERTIALIDLALPVVVGVLLPAREARERFATLKRLGGPNRGGVLLWRKEDVPGAPAT